MKIIILGSGSAYGCPMIFNNWRLTSADNPKNIRSRASVYLEIEGKKFVIDTGPEFRLQINQHKISDLDAVFITHQHYDHISSLPELPRACSLLEHNIEVWASEAVEKDLRSEYGFLFNNDDEPESAGLRWRRLPDIGEFSAAGITFQTFQVPHHHLRTSAFRYKDFAYITDWENVPDEGLKILQGVKLLLIECNNGLYPEQNGHGDLFKVKEVATAIGAEKVILTHLSARVDYDKTQAELPDNFMLAYDGLTIEF